VVVSARQLRGLKPSSTRPLGRMFFSTEISSFATPAEATKRTQNVAQNLVSWGQLLLVHDLGNRGYGVRG
jgi:hypothetical protein